MPSQQYAISSKLLHLNRKLTKSHEFHTNVYKKRDMSKRKIKYKQLQYCFSIKKWVLVGSKMNDNFSREFLMRITKTMKKIQFKGNKSGLIISRTIDGDMYVYLACFSCTYQLLEILAKIRV